MMLKVPNYIEQAKLSARGEGKVLFFERLFEFNGGWWGQSRLQFLKSWWSLFLFFSKEVRIDFFCIILYP